MMRMEIIVMERYMKIIYIEEKMLSYENKEFNLIRKLDEVNLTICC
jgi:hypothetical protein